MTALELLGPGRFIDPAVIQASAARGDDWYPHAAAMPLTPEATSQPRRTTTSTFLLHSMAGPRLTTLEALWAYMNRGDIVGECTWILDLDGRCAQLLPVEVRADTQYRANAYATSVETQDRGSPTLPTTPWSDPQLAQLAGLAAWQVLHPRLQVPLRRADRGWNGGGIDGHRRYPEWSIYQFKTCPGQARWEQIDDVLAVAQLIVDWAPTTPPTEEDDMPQKRFLARNKNNRNELRAGHGVVAVVYRSNEFSTLSAWLEAGVIEGAYYRPYTRGLARPGEPILSIDDVPELDETQLDRDVGYPAYQLTLGDEG